MEKKIKKIKYSKFSFRLQDKLYPRPLNAQIALTYRCNLKCLHCYVGSFRKASPEKEIDFSLFRNIIDQLQEAGILWLSFTGGEPFLRSDFMDIYTYVKEKGFIVVILTNGTLITPELIKLFKEYTPFYIDVSVNGAEPRVYEEISGVLGSFASLLHGLELLYKNKIPFRIKTTVMTLNLGEIPKLRHLAAKFKAPLILSPNLYPSMDRDNSPLRFRLSPKEMADFFKDEDLEREGDFNYIAQSSRVNSERLFRCGALRLSVFIDASANLLACGYLRQPRVDLREVNFHESYQLLLNQLDNEKFNPDAKCFSCEMQDFCEACPGMFYLESVNPQAGIGYFCQVAKIRYEEKKKALVQDCGYRL